MNENPNNRSGIPQKQINRVVAPIQVDQSGNKIEQPQQVAPKIVNTSIRQVVNPNGAPQLPPEKPKKEHDQTNTVFAVVLLIILACVCGFTFYIIVPRFQEKENRLRYNDITTLPAVEEKSYTFKSVRLGDGSKITTTNTFTVDGDFQVSTIADGASLSVLINNQQVTTTKAIVANAGRVDDLIVMLLNDGNSRQNRVVAYDKTGNSVWELRNIEGVEGMMPLGESSSLIVNANSLVVLASRAVGNNLLLNSTYGELNGTNVCDVETLNGQGISDNYVVLGTYSINYMGDHKFDSPFNITSVNLKDYKTSNNYCQ